MVENKLHDLWANLMRAGCDAREALDELRVHGSDEDYRLLRSITATIDAQQVLVNNLQDNVRFSRQRRG
jgi:hypothetical protein